MDHLQGEQDRQQPSGSGFSATLELPEIEPLITLIRRLGGDAELRVHGVDGGSGHLS